MKLFKKLTLSILLISNLTSPIMAAQYAIKIEDTFTYRNAENLYTGLSKGQTTYAVSSDNRLKVKGSTVDLSGNIVSAPEWRDMHADANGIAMRNIIGVHNTSVNINSNAYGVAVAWTSDKTSYVMKENGGLPIKVTLPNHIVSAKAITTNTSFSNMQVLYMCDDNKLFLATINNNNVTAITEVGLLDDMGDIKQIEVVSKSDIGEFVVLDSKGQVYRLVVGTDTQISWIKTPAYEVDKLIEMPSNTSNTIGLMYNDGNLNTLNIDSNTFTRCNVNFGSPILNVVSDSNGRYLTVETYKGEFFYLSTNMVSFRKINLKASPIATWGSSNGWDNWYFNENNEYEHYDISSWVSVDQTEYNKKIEKWVNEVPIVKETVLGNFNIEKDTIFKRQQSYPIEFSVVLNSEPKAFNLYYAHVGEVNNKSNWKLIESNIQTSMLNEREYDTGVEYNGDTIKGKTYTYTWKVGNENLTNIQLIAEPVYA